MLGEVEKCESSTSGNDCSGAWRPSVLNGSRIVPLLGRGVSDKESQTML